MDWKEYLESKAQMVIKDWGCEEDGSRATVHFNTLHIPKETQTLERYKDNGLIFFSTHEEIERLKKEYTWYDEVNNEWDLVAR